jgi:uncharacterized protein YdeI (YjbR/CyaY-like superfamily)
MDSCMNSERAAEPGLLFANQLAWATWLAKNHGKSPGVWLRLAKKSSGVSSVTYAQAIESALCYGWIDGQKKSFDDHYWLQRFTPRSDKSIWSKINREKALTLIEGGHMKSAGLREIERARSDGRWKDAYDSARTASVPEDLQAELDRNPKAKAFFATLNAQNRYAVLFRIQTARKPETRARKIKLFVNMLENHEMLYPR